MSRYPWFWLVAALLIAFMGFVQVRSALQETQTFDEGFDLAAGYSYWKTGDYRINREHPPLGKLINAIPLLFLNPSLPLDHPSWAQENNVVFGEQFLYFNRVPADTMLFAGRAMTILVTLLAAAAFAIWMRKLFGGAAALIGLVFFCLDPNLIAHGRYITSDLFVTVFFFFASIGWAAYLEQPRRRTLLLSGLLLGLAFASKISALYLIPAFLVLYFIRWWQKPKQFGILHMAGSMAALLVLATLVLALVYAPEASRLVPATRSYRQAHPEAVMLHDAIERKSPASELLADLSRRLGLQNHSFLVAFNMILTHNTNGHPAYVLGHVSEHGIWYYFPVAFAVKTPAAVLLALLLALAIGLRRQLAPLRGIPSRLRSAPIVWYVLLLIPMGYFALSMAGSINIGVRHILPVYPFLFALLGATLAAASWTPARWTTAALLMLMAFESISIYPHYLAFFNFPSGGPGNGPKYLVDSNIDWGQDVKKLRDWLKERGIPKVWFYYFGKADLTTYGLRFEWLPQHKDSKEWDDIDGYVAVSVTPLQGVYTSWDYLQRVRQRPVVAKIGYSIYIYDFRKPASRSMAAPILSTSLTK
jgi:4-amino-4-deoxy-L-arabinose transferase-like glycosyltransferase